jgi:hypothetical protein
MKLVKRIICGQEAWVKLCPVSKRRAASSIQKPYNKRAKGAKGALFIAKEREEEVP